MVICGKEEIRCFAFFTVQEFLALLPLLVIFKNYNFHLENARINDFLILCRDGQLKRMKPKKEWKERQQEEFSKRLKLE